MSRITGASDSMLNTHGNSPSGTLGPRGAAGVDTTPDSRATRGIKCEIRSIKEAERTMVGDITAIQGRLNFLSESGVKGGSPWFSYDKAASFDEWVAKNREVTGGPRSLRAVLQGELSARLGNLQSLQNDVERLKRLEKLNSDAQRDRRLKEAPGAAIEDVARITEKFIRKLKRGTWDKVLSNELAAEIDRALDKWVQTGVKDASAKNLKGLVYIVCQSRKLGIDTPGIKAALEEFGNSLRRRKTVAERNFRQSPTAENFDKYAHEWGQASLAGADPQGLGSAPKRLHGAEGPYTVRPGDTLRSISKEVYGNDNLWDHILFSNLGKVKVGLPLHPGTQLLIPSR